MPFPKTESGLAEQGYKFANKGTCRGCKAEIEWWDTPKNKMIPLDPGTLEPHWGTCPKRDDFKKKP